MLFVSWVNRNKELLLILVLAGISLAVCSLRGYLKIQTLYAWGYTSDLFTFDTTLQEILRGHFGLEFTFGNTFGDHSEPFLVLLLPVKLLLQNRMAEFLILMAPLSFFFCSLVMFFAMRNRTVSWKAFFLTLSLVFGFSVATRGLYESIYGFHPDTFSGFVAITFTSFLIWYEDNRSRGRITRLQLYGFWLFFVIYLSLKEEMALLAVIYFLIALLFKRNRLHLAALLVAVVVFALEYWMIQVFQTPFNRSNSALLSGLIESFQTYSFGFLLQNPTGDSRAVILYWGTILSGVCAFVMSSLLIRKINLYAACLFLAGLVKMILSLFVADFDIFTWHNFPGVIMMIGAVLWQFSEINRSRFWSGSVFVVLISLVSCVGFLLRDIPFILNTYHANLETMKIVTVYNSELAEVRPFVPSERVVAIPGFSVVQWAGYRYSFYPRGVSLSPVAIADYVVYPKNVPYKFTNGSDTALPLDRLQPDFIMMFETTHFILLKRIAVSEVDQPKRENFYHLFGMDANLILP